MPNNRQSIPPYENTCSASIDLIAILEPGGYLQWVEYDPSSTYIDWIDSDLQRTATEKFLATIKSRRSYEYVLSVLSSTFFCAQAHVDNLRKTNWCSIAGLQN